MVIPTVAEPPPKTGAKEIQSEDYQIRSCAFSSIASMSGGCQVNDSLSVVLLDPKRTQIQNWHQVVDQPNIESDFSNLICLLTVGLRASGIS